MFTIETQRLKLIPLTHELLLQYELDRAAMERSLGLEVSSMQIDQFYQHEVTDALVHFWIPMTHEHRETYRWYTSWEIVLKSTNTSIGGIGFTGYPDPHGNTEVGFMLDERMHGNGYATEALLAMTDWAFSDTTTKSVTARTHAENKPARRLLVRAGFRCEETQDGLVSFRKMK